MATHHPKDSDRTQNPYKAKTKKNLNEKNVNGAQTRNAGNDLHPIEARISDNRSSQTSFDQSLTPGSQGQSCDVVRSVANRPSTNGAASAFLVSDRLTVGSAAAPGSSASSTHTPSGSRTAKASTGENRTRSLASKGDGLCNGEQAGLQAIATAVQTELPPTLPSVIVTQTNVPVPSEIPTTVPLERHHASPATITQPNVSLPRMFKETTPAPPHGSGLKIQTSDTPVNSSPALRNEASQGHLVSGSPLIQATPAPPKPKPTTALRRGKWTVEEEAYVARVIQDFNSGYLNAPAGTTLRSYLSEKLHCDPMRITKKFTGDACIGKRVFHPAVRCPSNTAAIDKAQVSVGLTGFVACCRLRSDKMDLPLQTELDALERRWRRRLEMQQRESAKKAAASAAAAAAAASGRNHLNSTSTHVPTTAPQQAPVVTSSPQLKQNAVARTASWLDRANAILSPGGTEAAAPLARNKSHVSTDTSDHAQAVRSLPPQEIEDQMKEVQKLIHEGPIIQQTTAGLPHLLEARPKTTHPENNMRGHSLANSEEDVFDLPRDKRPRRLSGAEDAEALVGFLNSVRASAAASGGNSSSS
eukprot:CAMPEP_0116867836 /NCGR_PEP_ID=MMETSP0418-20121206/26846_1 /TAXON_ID=1158023 /ORGANISM="Astrosyne radiata, Strain 13vi08-1A" /LENGTH=585 /DNA_ID=CAMNT_0004503707 /DNA_START=454 /DNA_END=2211 /DNA_ORIENTATION=+